MSSLSIGVMASLGSNFDNIKHAREWGATSIQLVGMSTGEAMHYAHRAREVSAAEGMRITSFWCSLSGRTIWNFTEGPMTIGIVPPEFRKVRVAELKLGADIAAAVGTTGVNTHVGFIPIDPNDERYLGTVEALKEVADYCGERNLYFNFETGQEPPVVLRRCIEDIGRPNLGVNLDPANLLMYGNANPVDALDLIGKYVRDVHAKDGEYPTDGWLLGLEKPLGEGRVNFPALIAKLKSIGYCGSLTIEREISGPQQIIDIKNAIKLLSTLI